MTCTSHGTIIMSFHNNKKAWLLQTNENCDFLKFECSKLENAMHLLCQVKHFKKRTYRSLRKEFP